jgi:competence protein ComEC
MAGQDAQPPWPAAGEATPDGALRCDSQACIYWPEAEAGPSVSIVSDPAVLGEDCLRADFVVSLVPLYQPCPAALGVIDRFDLWRAGAHAIWFSGEGVRIESVAEAQGERPWAHWPESRDEDQ